MVKHIRINADFESYSEADIKIVGAHHYARHRTTDLICLAYCFDDEEPLIYIAGEEAPFDLFEAIAEGSLVYAWNTTFEYIMWEEVCVKKLGWPPIPFDQWRDTQAIASTFGLPLALGNCGKALGLDMQKDKRGDELIKLLCKPQKITKKQKLKRFTPESHPELFDEMYEYCKQDVRSERAILKALPWELQGNELETWRIMLKKNTRGIPMDTELVDSVVEIVEEYLEEVEQMLPILTGGVVKTIGQRKVIMEWCEEQGYELPGFTAEDVEAALKDPEIENYPGVKNILEMRTLAGKSSIKKFVKIQEAVCSDGRIRDCLKYHKAPTGREGGRLLQPQNLPRAEVEDTEDAIARFKTKSMEIVLEQYSDLLYTASALIRPSICAPKGRKFVVSDYSSIENRVVCWLAGQDDILQKLEGGVCLYTDMAATLYNVDYSEIPKESERRRHGKLTVLGAGYGMGWRTFLADCAARGFILTATEAKRTIDIFRDKYNMVKALWYGLKDAAEEATINPGEMTSYGMIQFMHHENYLFMVLPNGKTIAYPNARYETTMAPWGETTAVTHDRFASGKIGRASLSPGRLAENAAQGTAREVLMEAQIDLENHFKLPEWREHETILTVHDEVVIEAPTLGISIDEVNEILCNRSAAFIGLPLKAAGFETIRYHK